VLGRLAPLLSSSKGEWYTPPEVIERAIRVLGAIDLDPASDRLAAASIPAARYYTQEQDGLALPWAGRVWLNPPYGRVIGLWVAKLVAEYEAGRVTAAIALLPARPDTRWWQRLAGCPICFVRGRLRFSGQGTGAPFPSAVAALGCELGAFASAFGELGDVWRRVPRQGEGALHPWACPR